MRLSIASLAAFWLSCTLAVAAHAQTSALGLHVAPCTRGQAKTPALCGTFGVYENPAAHSGRIISLAVVVLRAQHPSRSAIAFIPGGPGQGATAFAPLIADGAFAKAWSPLRDRYNILFVDNRGMGDSNPFKCSFVPPGKPAVYFRQLFPDDLVAECRKNSSATSDANFYNTSYAVDDLDAVRSALGYPKLVLSGGSYGTLFSLVYVRRHPAHVESAILDGMLAPHFLPLPGSPDGAQTAFEDIALRCRADQVCNAHFPAFAEHFGAVMHRFDNGPVAVPVKVSMTGPLQNFPLSKEVLVDRLRQAMYEPENAATIPFVIEAAYRSDYAPLGDLVSGMSLALASALNMGAFLSYTCADEMPFIGHRAAQAAGAVSFTGDLRYRAQRRACAIWNVRAVPQHFNDVVRTTLPILILTGSDDPATPPRAAREALPYLPNARQVVVKGAGHTTETPCTDNLIVQFVRARSAKGLDLTKCSVAFKQPPFALGP